MRQTKLLVLALLLVLLAVQSLCQDGVARRAPTRNSVRPRRGARSTTTEANSASVSGSGSGSKSVQQSQVILRNARNAPQSLLVEVQRASVKIGRLLPIEQNMLRVTLPIGASETTCRVSVVSEPHFQVVGELFPKTFNCEFKEGEVQYRHSGSTLLARDFVKLRVTVFWNSNVLTREVRLEIDVQRNATYDTMPLFNAFETLLEARIRESSNAISSDVLKVQFDPLKSVCRVAYRPTRFWPARGSLTSSATRAPQSAFDMECSQFLLSAFRYEHHGDITLDRDYLPLQITVTSVTSETLDSRTECIYLPVMIVGGKVNEAPRISESRDSVEIDTVLSEPAIIPIDNFAIYDAESDSNDLVVSVVDFGNRAAGEVVNLDSPNYATSSFYVKDLADGRVGIRLTYFAYRVEFTMQLMLIDAQQNYSSVLSTRVIVNLQQREPFHFFTQPVSVLADGQSALTLANLQPKANQTGFINALKILGLYKFEPGRQLDVTVEEQKLAFKVDLLSSQYGQLVDEQGNAISSFKLRDLFFGNVSKVFFKHKQPSLSECASCLGSDYLDKVDVISNYSDWSVRLSIPVRIVTSDKLQRALFRRDSTVSIQRGQTICLSPEHVLSDELAQSDTSVLEQNFVTSSLLFSVRVKAANGLLTVLPNLNVAVRKFTYAQLLTSSLCYKHTQTSKLTDSLGLITPVGETSRLNVVVNANRGTARSIECDGGNAPVVVSVKETEVLQLASVFRCRFADGSPQQELAYRVVAQPYANTTQWLTDDCGKLVDGQERADRTDSTTEISKQRLLTYSPLASFAQPVVAANRLLYVPAGRDVGISERVVTFVYQATDGNAFSATRFVTIRILPVNNQPPKVIAKRFVVKRGGTLVFRVPDNIVLSDEDTNTSAITVTVRSLPTVGQLKIGTANARVGQTLTYANMLNGMLSYVAVAARAGEDTRFEVAANDGNNTQVFPVLINVLIDQLVTTRRPRSRLIVLNTTLICEENQQVDLSGSIVESIFSLADSNEDLSTVKLLILRYPTLGSLQRNGGRLQGVCTYSDMQAGYIAYKHLGEVGFQPKIDSVTFFVNTSDLALVRASPWAEDILARTQFQLRVTVVPVDNQTPRLTIWSSINVQEAGEAQLLPEHFLAADDDTESGKLEFVVTQRPSFGQLEVRGPQRRILADDDARFSWDEFESGAVYYVQSVHRGVEPTSDRFLLNVSDGSRVSDGKWVSITVHPQTDEEPQVNLANLTVQEGGTLELDESVFSFSSADLPAVTIFFVIVKPPMHGNLRAGLRNISFFTSDELRDRQSFKLNYKHDGSNTHNDSFTLRVSNGASVLERTCQVTIEPVNDDRPMVKVNRAIFGATGSSYVLRNTDLLVTDSDTNDDNITFRLTASGGVSGSFALDDLEVRDDSFFTQADVNSGRVTYHFPESIESGKRSVLEKATFTVSDGVQSIRMQFSINVTAETVPTTIGEADFNFSAADISNLALGARVELSPARLKMLLSLPARRLFQADPRLITYRLESATNGRVVHKNNLLTPIDTVENIESFTRQDVEQKNIFYRAPEVSDTVVDECIFTVEVPRFSVSKTVTLSISFNTSVYEMPVVQRNEELSVVRRSRLAIADSKLLATDVDTAPANIVFRIVQQPKNGRLVMDTTLRPARTLRAADYVVVQSFTQLDVDRNLVYYQHDDVSAASDDHFEFVVTDPEHVFFVDNSTGVPLTKDSRKETLVKRIVITSSDETVTERSRQSWLNAFRLSVAVPNTFQRFNDTRAHSFGYTIGRELFEIDFDLDETATAKQDFVERNLRDSVFVITRKPSFGSVRNVNRRRMRVDNFTLADVSAGYIRYIASSPSTPNNDYFTFNLIDSQTRLTLSSNERINFAWPVVEFAKGSLSVCYNVAGYLTINLTQRGGTPNQSATVRIVLKDPSKKVVLLSTLELQNAQNTDKLLGEVAMQVSQSAAQVSQVFNMRFLAHDLYQVILEEKNNVAIGSSKTATVSVINCTDGKTEDFTDLGRVYGLRKDKTTAKPRVTAGPRRRAERTTTDSSAGLAGNSRSLISAIGNAGPMNDPPMDALPKRQTTRKLPSKRERNSFCLPSERNLHVYETKTRVVLRCDGKKWTVVKSTDAARAPRQAASCLSGWTLHNRMCYKASSERVSWHDAKKRCSDSGAHLVTVQSRSVMEWLFGLNGRQTFWIGLHQNGYRKWEYSSKRKPVYFEWAENYPTGYAHSGKNCVLINNFQWYNRLCSVPTRFICELPSRT